MLSHGFVGTERFELIRRLGEGGFGTVYEALDRKRSTRVALKLLRHAEGTTLYRFKREFRALADISHPNLVALDELLTDGLHWFFTMELVRGVPIVEYTGPDQTRLRHVLPQLVEALNAIHRAGIIHCDIKPSNVLVTTGGRVVVLDFGLVSERPAVSLEDDSADLSREEFVVLGTPAYMAPEQATTQPVTAAADWYGVGVILYQVLTGQLPFLGSHVDVIEAKRSGRPRPPDELNPAAANDIARLTMRLLHPNPTKRPSGETILRAIERRQAPVAVAMTIPPTAAADVLFGRESHLRALRDALDGIRTAIQKGERGGAVVAFVSGLSGMGKTALIRHFLQEQRLEDPELVALTGRCYERESIPYKAIDPLIDALTQHLQRLRDIEVARLLPRDTAILARLFPVLLGVSEIQRAPYVAVDALDTVTVRQRAAAALRELLDRLASRVPLMLVIDDLQWGDADSGSILQEVLRPPDPPPFFLIAAYRSQDAADAKLLRTLNRSIRAAELPRIIDIEVGALADDEARQLAIELVGEEPAAAERGAAIARESGGNPFFLHQLAEHALTVGGATSLGAVVLDRVGVLPAPTRQLLTAIALSAHSIPVEVARAAAGLAPDDRQPLQALRVSRLVRGGPEEPNVEPYHDRIREAVVTQLAGDDLRDWHERLATAWEHSGVARPETLVAHYHAAGNVAKTCEHAVAAAEHAEEALAFDRAAEFYQLLVRHEGDPTRQRQWTVKLGHALANAGRGHEAAHIFLTALDGAIASEALELERRAASELIRAGYLKEAAEVLERLLPKVGVRPARNELQAFVSLLTYRLRIAARGIAFHPRAESQIAPGILQRIDVLRSIGEPLALTSLVQGAALVMQAAWHALRAREPRRVVIALTGIAAFNGLSGTGRESSSLTTARKAQELARELDDPWAIGRAMMVEGLILKVCGHWNDGARQLERAITILATCRGVRWEIETAQLLIHDALYWTGEWTRLARELSARRQDAEQRGDLYSATHVAARLSPLMHLAADRVDQARLEVREALHDWTATGRHFHLQHRFVVCTSTDIDLYSGNPGDAWTRLMADWPNLKRIAFVMQFSRVEMLFYRARVALALATAGDRAALRQAARDGRRLHREGAGWARALALLVEATIQQARGSSNVAILSLEAAEAALRGCDMNLYAAAARYRRGCLTRGAAGQTLVDEARVAMQQQQIVKPERLVNLLAPGPWSDRPPPDAL
jgi:eukaryotic-like serine/threonine-protein kinase